MPDERPRNRSRLDRRPGPIAGAILVAGLALAAAGQSTDLYAPPRFDGAGYAVLAESLRTGRGYREIDHPDAPRHAHFPPGYPALLAGLWRLTGPSAPAARGLSLACTAGAAALAWLLFRRWFRPGVALTLAAALAVNWQWARTGGEIQSEPPFLVLSTAALLAADAVRRRPSGRRGAGLGLLLGACVLTRHVGAALAAAVVLDLALRRTGPGRRAALCAALACGAVVAPWAGWIAGVGRGTQVELLPRGGLAGLAAEQALFYLRRLPDQIVGPVVEVATVFRPGLAAPATALAAAATAVVSLGWLRMLRGPRRRLAGLVPLLTLALLLVWPFTEAGRFLIPLVPLILLGAAEGLAALLARFVGPRRARPVATALVLLASIPYPAYSLISGRAEAARARHADFDAACAWIAAEGRRPGPVLTRQPGEAFWLMGRSRTALKPPADPDAIDAAIGRYGVAYLIVDEGRYAASGASPLERYAEAQPDGVRPARARGEVTVFEVVAGRPAP